MSNFNWARMQVTAGGTGNLTLGSVSGYPTISDVMGTGQSAYYAIVDSAGKPIETGYGSFTLPGTLTRTRVDETYVAGTFDDTTPAAANIPVGAVLVLPLTKKNLLEIGLEYFADSKNSAAPNNVVNYVGLNFQATAPYDGGFDFKGYDSVSHTGGAFSLQIPDGTAVGGNKRGKGAIDLQSYRAGAASVASGADSIAIGNNSKATGIGATAIGNIAGTNSDYAVALGQEAFVDASSDGAVAVGYGANAFGQSAVVVGYFGAAGLRAISIGGSYAGGVEDISIGWGAYTYTTGTTPATALGYNAVVNHDGGIAIGSAASAGSNGTGAENSDSIAIGTGALAHSAYANDSIAIGHTAEADKASDIAIGKGAVTNGGAAIGIGKQIASNGADSIAIGTFSGAVADSTIAIGSSATAADMYAVAIGGSADAHAPTSVAVGVSALVQAVAGSGVSIGNSAAVGKSTGTTSGLDAIAIGHGASANAGATDNLTMGVAIGKYAEADGQSAVALGENAFAQDSTAISIGSGSNVRGGQTVAIGNSARVGSLGSGGFGGGTAIGNNAGCFSADGIAIGTYSDAEGGDAAIAIGSNSFAQSASAVALGGFAYAYGVGSTALGDSAEANGDYSVGIGANSKTRGIIGRLSRSANQAAKQAFSVHLRAGTTNNTPTVATADGAAAGTTNQVVLPDTTSVAFKGLLVAREAATGNTSTWEIKGAIRRGANAAATVLIGSTVAVLNQDAGASAWTVGLTADTTNGALAVTVTGEAAKTITWFADIAGVELIA